MSPGTLWNKLIPKIRIYFIMASPSMELLLSRFTHKNLQNNIHVAWNLAWTYELQGLITANCVFIQGRKVFDPKFPLLRGSNYIFT
jgi:hypothetical protein